MIADKLTADEFSRAIERIKIGDRPCAMARSVLVDGIRQADCARSMNVSRNAVSLAVNRVRKAHREVPEGFERVTALLPLHQASIVRKWQAHTGLEEVEK